MAKIKQIGRELPASNSLDAWFEEEEAERPGWIADIDYSVAPTVARHSKKPVQSLFKSLRRLGAEMTELRTSEREMRAELHRLQRRLQRAKK